MPNLLDMGSAQRGYYCNSDAVEKVIRYITRTRWNEDRKKDLVLVGGAGVQIFPFETETVIKQFLYVQNAYNIKKRKGRRVYHYVLSFKDEEFFCLKCDYTWVDLIAREISGYFFNAGHQVIYGIHYEENKRVHIHFAVNSINFINGLKYHINLTQFKEMEMIFNTIFEKYCGIANVRIEAPIIFYNIAKINQEMIHKY